MGPLGHLNQRFYQDDIRMTAGCIVSCPSEGTRPIKSCFRYVMHFVIALAKDLEIARHDQSPSGLRYRFAKMSAMSISVEPGFIF